ncbi:hypothetical protein H5410_042794 [Solanum commersonii]|uniref:Uncharacterized protein n=1 Tax=Solanum commersonii TaxID=4109 RepID=A0A9J5XYH2_SOLCO|nr:hypothetical protein H5410_042794 [Solanum commersonii]
MTRSRWAAIFVRKPGALLTREEKKTRIAAGSRGTRVDVGFLGWFASFLGFFARKKDDLQGFGSVCYCSCMYCCKCWNWSCMYVVMGF